MSNPSSNSPIKITDQSTPTISTSNSLINRPNASSSVPSEPTINTDPQQGIISLETKVSSSDRVLIRKTIENMGSRSVNRDIQSLKVERLMGVNLMKYEQLPSAMLNDFMSPYYLIFR